MNESNENREKNPESKIHVPDFIYIVVYFAYHVYENRFCFSFQLSLIYILLFYFVQFGSAAVLFQAFFFLIIISTTYARNWLVR